jgi:hypothetical protein
MSVATLTVPELYTDVDGVAKWRDIELPLSEGSPAAQLSTLRQGGGHQFRMSPIGFRSAFHCTTTPQWLIVMQGEMEIGLQDGSTRSFQAGQCFYSNDTPPANAVFDARVHGHCSRQVGDQPLVTVFIRS